MNRRGTKPARSVSFEDVLVFYTPNDLGSIPNQEERHAAPQMATKEKAFVPRTLAVAKGEEVAFPNLDRILHNVFSVSGKNQFDLDLYGAGESRKHSFKSPGLVRVFCNVHRDMVGYVWVLDAPFSASPDNEGRFVIDGLPLGAGTLTLWHERAEPLEVEVQVGALSKEQVFDLAITRPRLPSHSRKDGSAYRQRRTYN